MLPLCDRIAICKGDPAGVALQRGSGREVLKKLQTEWSCGGCALVCPPSGLSAAAVRDKAAVEVVPHIVEVLIVAVRDEAIVRVVEVAGLPQWLP